MANQIGENTPQNSSDEEEIIIKRSPNRASFKKIGEICGLYKTMVVVRPHTLIYLYGVDVGATLYLEEGDIVLGSIGEIVRPLRFLLELRTNKKVGSLQLRLPVYMRKFLLYQSQRNRMLLKGRRQMQCIYSKISNTLYGAYKVQSSPSTSSRLKLREMYGEFLDEFKGQEIDGSKVRVVVDDENAEEKFETKNRLFYPDLF